MGAGPIMSETNFSHGPRSDGAFAGPLDQETFRALLFNSFLHQQNQLRARRQKAEELLSAIAAACRSISDAADLRTALNAVATNAIEITGSTGVALAISEGGQMSCWAMSGPTAPPLGSAVSPDSGLSGECLRTRRIVRCDDASSDPRVNLDACARLGGVTSMLLVPLLRRSEVFGVLVGFSIHPRAFDEIDECVLQLFATIATSTLVEFAPSEAVPRVTTRALPASIRTAPSQMSPV